MERVGRGGTVLRRSKLQSPKRDKRLHTINNWTGIWNSDGLCSLLFLYISYCILYCISVHYIGIIYNIYIYITPPTIINKEERIPSIIQLQIYLFGKTRIDIQEKAERSCIFKPWDWRDLYRLHTLFKNSPLVTESDLHPKWANQLGTQLLRS